MASEFKIGDCVWAKLKGFPTWPGKIIEPKPEVKRPADKKRKYFVLFLGSDNYAWVQDECIWHFAENRERFMITQKVPKGFLDAVNAMDELVKNAPPRKEFVKEDVMGGGDASSKVARSNQRSEKLKGNKRDETVKGKKDKDAKADTVEKSKTPKTTEGRGKKRESTVTEGSAKPAKQRRSMSSGDAALPSLSPKASTDFDDALVAHASGNHRSKKKDESVKSPFMPDVLPSSPVSDVFTRHANASPLKIGFLGLGTIGSAIVSNLLKTGHEVTVWNRTMSKCRDYIRDGALRGNSPCEVVQSCDITMSCVSDPSALKDLVFGNSGVLQGISSGKAYVDMSTVDTETISDVCEAVMARGGRFLEAPVIGDRQLAADGRLIILAAGDQTVYDDCASCFEAIGKKFFLGDMGLGTRMKLVLNMFVGTTLAALAESLALSAKLGLSLTHVLDVLRHSSATSKFVQEKGADMAASRFTNAGCKLALMQKDLKLAINMSDSVDQPLHVGSAVNELFKKAKAKGYADNDIAAVYRAANL